VPATVQPVMVTPGFPLLLAFYKGLLGAVEISRVPVTHHDAARISTVTRAGQCQAEGHPV
jgi:hypothetical protein